MSTIPIDRREFVVCAAASAEARVRDGRASPATPREDAAGAVRRPPATPPELVDLVRHATLAASGHNTQPWRFHAADDEIVVSPDLGRRTPVVDPDDHHLYASLGCAAENLALAARAAGRGGEAGWQPGGDGAVRIGIASAPPETSALFDAIPERQVSRATYDARPVATDAIERLRQAGSVHGVEVLVIGDATDQATEVLPMRRELQALLGIGSRRPSLLVRFGHGPAMPRSSRRPLEKVLV